MGCASSKPSSSSKNKKKDSSSNTKTGGKSKPNDLSKNKSDANGKAKSSSSSSPTGNELDELIKIDKKLLSQIDQHRDDVVNYIVNLVRRDLNAELVTNGNHSAKGNMAALATAALSAPDNDSLITEASAKAISLIKGGKCETYRNLADSLKSSTFLCKNQTHKPRICDLTADTIRRCLNDIYSQPSRPDFNLLAYLQAHQDGVGVDLKQQLTPPATPQKIDSQKTSSSADPGSPNEFNDSILLSRAEANKVARILFLTNRARPVIHASQKKRGAYFVNIQQDDNSEVPATRQQIEEIISPSAANRHQEQPSIYEVAETFLNNSEVALKLSPLWQSSSVSTPTHTNAAAAATRLSTSPPVSPVQVHDYQHPAASSFDTPETPVVAGRRTIEEVELIVEQVQTSSTPLPADESAASTTNETTKRSSIITETTTTSPSANLNTTYDVADETIETDPAAGVDESDARIQLGAAANLIMLANSLQNSSMDEHDATVPNGGQTDDEIVVDQASDVNTSNDQRVEETSDARAKQNEDQVPSSASESTNLDQNNNADIAEEQPVTKQQQASEGMFPGVVQPMFISLNSPQPPSSFLS